MANVWKIAWVNLNDKQWHIMNPAPGTYHADPFIFDDYLFFELYDYKKGVIAVRPWPDGPITVVLEEDHHLSFPCVWEDEGEHYMMPETGAGPIKIYQAKRFPYEWELVDEIPGVFGDSIMFGEDVITTEGNDDLFTVIRDGKKIIQEMRPNSRAAGHIYLDIATGDSIRPCQITGAEYGSGVVMKKINPDTYEEEEISRHTPIDPQAKGMHTLNVMGDKMVVDLKYEA